VSESRYWLFTFIQISLELLRRLINEEVQANLPPTFAELQKAIANALNCAERLSTEATRQGVGNKAYLQVVKMLQQVLRLAEKLN